MTSETNVSTENQKARTHPRLPRPDGLTRRPRRPRPPPGQGSSPPRGLTVETAPARPGQAASRLRAARDIDRVYRRGRLTRTPRLLIRVLPNHLDHSRLTTVVSKKTASSAVVRNRLRRQVNEAWRKAAARQAPGLDIIATVIGADELVPATTEDALSKGGVLK